MGRKRSKLSQKHLGFIKDKRSVGNGQERRHGHGEVGEWVSGLLKKGLGMMLQPQEYKKTEFMKILLNVCFENL